MGKFVNQNGKIRVLVFRRCGVNYYVCRRGMGIFINFKIAEAIRQAQRGYYSSMQHNYELVNRTIKNNPILKLRDAQPDGLLILQKPKQLTLGI
jgi:hypothetical protein